MSVLPGTNEHFDLDAFNLKQDGALPLCQRYISFPWSNVDLACQTGGSDPDVLLNIPQISNNSIRYYVRTLQLHTYITTTYFFVATYLT